MRYVLGLDLGTSSAGWAVLALGADGEPSQIVDAGVRIFEAPVEPKTQAPKNLARRTARQHRRQLARRKQRRLKLTKILQDTALLPSDEEHLRSLLLDDNLNNPYELRRLGLSEKLSDHQFGRVLFHLNQRRGFKSNRKTSFGPLIYANTELASIIALEEDEEIEKVLQKSQKLTRDADDDGVVKAGISLLKSAISKSSSRTLGEYLCKVKNGQVSRPAHHENDVSEKVRGLFAERSMYEHEFESLWKFQSSCNERLTDELKARIYDAIFWQRPLARQKFLVGDCVFEYHRKRAAKATLQFQHFRVLQTVNDLEIKNTDTRDYRAPSEAQRKELLRLLMSNEKLSWSKVKKALQIHRNETINFEDGGKEELLGDSTSSRLSKILGVKWTSLSSPEREALVTDVLTIERKDWLLKRLMSHWKFSAAEAYKLAILALEPGYCSLSIKALNKLIPLMQDGLNYRAACDSLGYAAVNQRPSNTGEILPKPPNLRNPVVQKALHQVKRLVTAIVLKYGIPEIVRVELARDMKLSKKQKTELESRNRASKRERDIAREFLRSNGLQEPTSDDLLRYRLWKEAGMMCPYSGKPISMGMLFSADGEVDIDHIVPYSRCLDDSFLNKTICLASENRNRKKNLTPFEAYSKEPDSFENLLSRVTHMVDMPPQKRRKFEMKTEEINFDELVSRQLNDTRYISREVCNYLLSLRCKVQISKGAATAALRDKWGLNTILSADGSGVKNRRDHRHHAVDAIVVALTSPSLFKRLSILSAQSSLGLYSRRFLLDEPWKDFFKSAESLILGMLVSHEARRKILGKFHEDTALGPTEMEGQFVLRRPINKLKEKDLADVRDPVVKAILEERLKQSNGSLEKAFSSPIPHKNGHTIIKKVRLNIRLNPEVLLPIGRPGQKFFKFHTLGNNHHVEVLLNKQTNKFEFEIVSTAESAKRARIEKKPIFRNDWGEDKTLVMDLCANDLVELDTEDGQRCLYRVKGFAKEADRRRISLQKHNVSSSEEFERVTANKFQTRNPCKVEIDYLGRISRVKSR